MSKSRHHNNNTFDDYEEERRPKKKIQDKYKERRIARALKTKNIEDIMKYEEEEEEENSHL